jgi:hypothetical protein
MKMILRVELTDGSVEEVTCVARFEQELKLTDLLFIAWHSLSRQKKTTKDFHNWLDDVEAIEPSETDPK